MKKLTIKFGLYFSLALFVLAAAALAFSVSRISPLLRMNDNCRVLRVDLGIPEAISNCVGARTVGGVSAVVHFNSLGFRDKERSEKKAGIFRVALLGGSTALGFGLTDDQTPAWRVEALLKEAGVTNVEFMNLSSEGYEAVRHSARIFEYLKELHPDLVILDTVRADKMVTDFIDWHEAELNDRGRVTHIRSLRDILGENFFDWLGANSVAGLWLRQMYTGYRLFAAAAALHWEPEERRSRLIKPQLHALRAMHAACAVFRCEIRVIWDPLEGSPADVDWITHWLFGYDLDFERLQGSFERNEIGLLDVSGLKPHRPDESLFQAHSRYYSAEGMERYSMALASAIRRIIDERAVKK